MDGWYYYQLSQPSLRLKLKQFHPSHWIIKTVPILWGSIWWGLAGHWDVDMMMTSKSWLNISRPKSWHLLVEWHSSFTVRKGFWSGLKLEVNLTWGSVATDHTQLHTVVGRRSVALGTPGGGDPGRRGVRGGGGVGGGQLRGGGARAEVESPTGVNFQGRLGLQLGRVGGRAHQLEGWLDGDLRLGGVRIPRGRPWAGLDCQTEVPRLLQFPELLMPFSSVARSRKSLEFIWKMTLCREKLPVVVY